MTQDQIEEYIEEVMADVKPELKEHFEYVFRDFDPQEEGPMKYATAKMYLLMGKRMIFFYTLVMEAVLKTEYKDDPKGWIKRLISHEIAHLFTLDQKEANYKQRNNKFFIHDTP